MFNSSTQRIYAKGSTWTLAVVIVSALALVAGIGSLFRLRFTSGDVFPPYSSLRADPLGTRALFDSVQRLPEIEAERIFTPIARLQAEPRSLLLAAGLKSRGGLWQGDTNSVEHLVQMAENGVRVVICFAPQLSFYQTNAVTGDDHDDASPEESAVDSISDSGVRLIALQRSMFSGLRFIKLDPQPDTGTRAERAAAATDFLPETLPWRGMWYFDGLGDDWTVIYAMDGAPVVIERRYGEGSIVLCADSFMISNEGLWRDRATAFIAWLLGDARQVMFLETHHGLSEQIGVMKLIRLFRLHGVLVGLFLLAALFIWQQRMPLLPSTTDEADGQASGGALGRDVYSGLTALLKRAIPARSLIVTCVDAWTGSLRAHERQGAAARRLQQHLEGDLNAGSTDPVQCYRDISNLIHERKKT